MIWNVVLTFSVRSPQSLLVIPCHVYRLIASTLAAIAFSHYRVAAKVARNCGVDHVQGSTIMVGEPTT